MSPTEVAGQLVWVGADSTTRSNVYEGLVEQYRLGGVFLLGGWRGTSSISRETAQLQAIGTASNRPHLGLFIAADQEGGQVQELSGLGFSVIPSASWQNVKTSTEEQNAASGWAKDLAAVGVNVDLAPVAGTVPLSLGAKNGPIGYFHRNFSSDPRDNSRMVAAFVKGLHDGGVASTIKHFPGLGRIANNTDTSASGITDSITSSTDTYLNPFLSGINAGTDFVMVGSAIYTQLDPSTNAVFSSQIISGLLRKQLGYSGVIVSDDLGNARSVAWLGPGERATRFIEAGGDVVLTASTTDVAPMADSIVARMASSSAFALRARTAAARIVNLKQGRHLVRSTTAC